MPDLDIVNTEMCTSTDGPLTANVGGYTQMGLFNERTWPQCTCKAYKFSKATINFGGRWVKPACKHIIQAQQDVCGWHKAYSPERQIEPGVCPKCGGSTVPVRWAV